MNYFFYNEEASESTQEQRFDRHQKIQALSYFQDDFSTLIDNISILVWYLKDPETFDIVNNTFAEFFGVQKQDIEHKNICSIIRTQDTIRVIQENKKVFNTKEKTTKEVWVSNNQGDNRLLSIVKIPKVNIIGDVEYVLCIAEDITGIKEKDEQSKKNEEVVLKGILDNIMDMVWSATWPEMKMLYISPSAEEFYGSSAKPFMENPYLWMEVVHPEDRKVVNRCHRLLAKNRSSQVEYRVVKANGTIAWVSSRTKLIMNEENVPIKVEGVIQDITKRKKAEDHIQKQIILQQLITEISSDFITANVKNIHQKIHMMLQKSGEFLLVDRCYLFLLSTCGKIMSNTHEWCAVGIQAQQSELMNVPLQSLPWWEQQIRQKDIVYIEDVNQLPVEASAEKAEFKRQKIKSLLCITLYDKNNRTIGFVGFDSVQKKRTWGEEQISLLKVLANTLSDALEKNKREKELEESNENLRNEVIKKAEEISELTMATIYALADLAESRDNNTGGHLKRMEVGCRIIAEKLSSNATFSMIDSEFIHNLQKASLLHDIGKVGIRDSILLKPGKLTADEFEEMKQHTLIGSRTLIEVSHKYPGNTYIEMGIEIAQSHHEKWDGTGYPYGIKGDQIPLSAQIAAIVDVYDALRTKRVYKEAYSHEKSRQIIIQGSGKHFSHLLVEAFLACEQELKMLYI